MTDRAAAALSGVLREVLITALSQRFHPSPMTGSIHVDGLVCLLRPLMMRLLLSHGRYGLSRNDLGSDWSAARGALYVVR